MSLLSLVVAIIVVGILLWAVNSFIPMQANIKKILNILVVCLVVVYILQNLGLLDFLNSVHVGKVHR
jgi:hypothetical protein